MNRGLLLVFMATLSLLSCRKEHNTSSWDSSLLFPVIKSKLEPSKILGDSLIRVEADKGLTLVYRSNVYEITPAEIISLPDTSIQHSVFSPISGWLLNPGDHILPVQEDQTTYSQDDIGLRFAVIRSGGIEFSVTSDITEKTLFIYRIPGASKDNTPFEAIIEIPAASSAGPGQKSGYFDLTGYRVDLSGKNGDKVNTFYSVTEGKLHPEAAPVVVSTGQSLVSTVTFKDIVPVYARGYFGQFTMDPEVGTSAFDLFSNIQGGELKLEELDVRLRVTNGIGADARFRLNKLESINLRTASKVSLNHPLTGNWFNLNRAHDQFGQTPPVAPFVYEAVFDNNNSNIKALLENLPGELSYEAEAMINPLGNVSGWNDFIHADYGIGLGLEIEMPLHFAAESLMMTDTIPFDTALVAQISNFQEGVLILHVENMFPFSADLSLVPGAGNSSFLDMPNIAPANPGTGGIVETPVTSRLEIPLNRERLEILKNSGVLVLTVTLNTEPAGSNIRIYHDYYMDIRLTADIRYRVAPGN